MVSIVTHTDHMLVTMVTGCELYSPQSIAFVHIHIKCKKGKVKEVILSLLSLQLAQQTVQLLP